ncbi:putative secreted protein (Por secretion system target) [Tenacibaculum adriaticum]|uniref:Putative secreted protein (Por secretion system target) n=1 Tax=Tenacibaculum adriaticum TaxID=413713 RepID=A0A5S5DTS9_9FLAO|nr:T9SS type A sorting domain-containing protein [Tenacibaculum adriaticum]TYP99301.1 putative secreted protein (Por secretion system target) [Tenacibaculum adriaticum]
MKQINYLNILSKHTGADKRKKSVFGVMYFTFLFFLSSFALQAQVGEVIWEDNFDTFNTQQWTKDIGDGCNVGLCGWGNQELQSYEENNVYVADVPGEAGNKALVLEAKRENSGSRAYTSGKVISDNKVAIHYGMVEVRVRVPNLNQGLWPAAWMLGTSNLTWPAKGEIDIMEMGFSQSGRDHQGETASTVNNYVGANAFFPTPGGGVGNIAYDVDYNKPYVAATPLNDRFVKYRIYWEPTQIRFTVIDGGTEYDLYENPFPIDANNPNTSTFTKPFYMLLNLAVGGLLPGITANDGINAPLPGKMYVDYVRVHKWNGHGSVTLSDGSIAAETGTFGVFTDTTPTTNKFAFGADSEFYIFGETLVENTTIAPYEGSNVLSFTNDKDKGWFGAGIISLFGKNMSNYSENGSLKFKIKIPADVSFIIGVNDNYTNAAEVTFPAGETKYGLVRDGEWGEVTIPIEDLGGLVAFQDMSYMFRIGSSGAIPATNFQFAIDDIVWVDGNTTGCQPTEVTPYYNINDQSWVSDTTVSLQTGNSVAFGPQPTTGGSWSWTGPNNFSATTREITLSNIQTSNAGNYTASFTNDCGVTTSVIFNVSVTTVSTFTPDPNKVYYINNPFHNKRIGANGSEDPFTASTTTTGATLEWKFTAAPNNSYYIDCVGGEGNTRLRSDNTDFTDMQPSSYAGTWESWQITSANDGKFYLTTLESDYKRLQMTDAGFLKQVSTDSQGTWEQFTFTEVEESQPPVNSCTKVSANGDFNVKITTTSEGSYLTFIPQVTSVGANTLILYYSTSLDAIYPGYMVQPNVPQLINANAGETVYFYYTYSLPTGGETNTANSKMNFIVGSCNDSARVSEAIVKKEKKEEFNIYPNPVEKELIIKTTSVNSYDTVVLMNSAGQVIENKKLDNITTLIIDTSNLKSGIYFIQLKGKTGVKTSKLVKQ